jgi:hypothetical protein
LQPNARSGEDQAAMVQPPAVTLDVKRGEFLYTGTFAAPAFATLPSEARIYGAIYGRFSPLGAGLTDIRMDGPAWSPGDVSISCSLHSTNVLVRYRLDRLEVWWGGLGAADIPTVVEAAYGALHDVSPDSNVRASLLHTTFHGEPREGDVGAWLQAHVPRPIDESDLRFMPNGVSFSAIVDPSGTGYVLVERSLLIQRGAFVRVTCEFPGEVPPRTACDRTAAFISTALARFGITMRGGDT